MEPLLRVINLTKNFGSLPAVQQISFDVLPGEVVGLAGRSGSGKSVLVMLLAGMYAPNQGDLYYNNRRLKWPFPANQLGIGVIHQKPDLSDNMDVTSNIFLGSEIGWPQGNHWFKIPNRRQMDREAGRILTQLDLPIHSLREKAAHLTSEERQMIAIARTLIRPAKIIIIDEPTLLLSYPYQKKLLGLIQSWREKDVAVIFSSNNLEHLFAVADRILVLRQGEKIADLHTDETNREEIIALLTGAPDRRQVLPTILALDSLYDVRKQTEQIRHHQMLLEKDLAAQDAWNQQLVDLLAVQVQALDRANLALQDAQRRLLTEREEERKHLARELHDQAIQDLLSIIYEIEELQTTQVDDLCQGFLNLQEGLRMVVDDLRQICSDLRPPTIDSLGLGPALQSYAKQWSEHSGIPVQLEIDPDLERLPETIELSIFRIIQEGLSNVSKHAQARHAGLSVRHTSPRLLMVSISDDGIGVPENFDFNIASRKGHYGLLGISERVALLGGRMQLQSRAGGGLQLTVEIPHPRAETAARARG